MRDAPTSLMPQLQILSYSAGPTTHSLRQPGMGGPHVFHRIQNLAGFTGIEYSPSPMNVTTLLGPQANHYLWVQGSEPRSIQLIEATYQRAVDMGAFALDLAGSGLAVAKGRYMFSVISGAW